MNHQLLRKWSLSLLIMLAAASSLIAQKKDLTPDDYAQWQSITQGVLSPDGTWFSHGISLVDGDGWIVLRQVGEETVSEHKLIHGFGQEFSPDGRWFAFRIGFPEERVKELRDRQEPVEYRLGLKNLFSSKVDTFSNISAFEFSEQSDFLLMHKYQAEGVQTRGRDVILRDLENGSNLLLGNVAESSFNEEGNLLAVLLDSHQKLGNGVQLIDLENLTTRVLESDQAEYKSLSWNEDGTALAFLKVAPHDDYKQDNHKIFMFSRLDETPEKKVFGYFGRDDFPEDTRIVDYRSLRWSEDGERLFFGVKEWERVEVPENDAADEENAGQENETTDETENNEGRTETGEDSDDLPPSNVEIWHWRDDPIQPRQKVMSQIEREANFLSVWHPGEDRFVQLEDDHDHRLRLMPKQNHAVLYEPTPYKPRFRESWNDIYVVDVQDGRRRKVLERHESVRPSAGGQYLLYFLENEWWSYNISEERHVNLTKDVDTRFNNYTYVSGREQDHPFGAGQWTDDDRWVLLYDRYDIYKVCPNGGGVHRLTRGAEDRIRYRQARLSRDEPALKAGEPFYASMFGERTKERGYARIDPQQGVETLIYEQAIVNRLGKAENSDTYIYMVQTAVDSPNFFYTDYDFEQHTALTRTNQQQEDYHWAGDELVSFVNDRGEQLEGRLLYPANYQPGKQYPMIVHIYERRSHTLHAYSMPDKADAYNQRRFSAEEYFVFEPDITYELRRPGMSAVESVVPAVGTVLETGMIDVNKIGLTGHSWGGYQTSFIITQTDLFSSAVAGAPLTNMISMYNSVYWNTGMPDATLFEIHQGRFPDPYWKDWDHFIENSPIFNIDRSETPLLFQFGTEDGAVDFHQGVELYNAMRRLELPAIMLVYEGENHSLGRRENRVDYAERAFQWHEHYLLGKEPVNWIIEGLPYIERPAMPE